MSSFSSLFFLFQPEYFPFHNSRVYSFPAKECKGRPPLFDDLTYFVLINAIYFKADWKHPFDKTKTKKKTFYVAKGRRHALMMYLKRKLDYAEIPSLQSTMIRLPYKGDRIVMDVLLPNAKSNRQFRKAVFDSPSLSC